jgi:hypothetical protein
VSDQREEVEDLYGLITGQYTTPRPVVPPKRIPLWKLEEMANGRPTRPDGWRGSTGPLLAGWELNPVHTSSATQDVRPRRKPWPGRAGAAACRWIGLKCRRMGVPPHT